MKFVYQPVQLQAWVSQNMVLDGEGVYQPSLEGLEGLKRSFRTIHDFMVDKWIWGLSRRERRLLPYLLQGAERKGSQLLWPFISRQLMDWRSFYILVDVLFRTDREEQVPILWMWLRRSYQYSWEQIERRMKSQQIRLWRRWLETPTQPACCLADMALEEERYYLDVLHDVGLTEKHPFFQQVWQETLRLATKEFFLQQEELCRLVFEDAAPPEREQMAKWLIHRNVIDWVPSLGRLIYDKMRTYRMKPQMWQNISEQGQHEFHEWVVRWKKEKFSDFYHIFHERIRYWRKFIYRLRDVRELSRERTVVMYFSDDVVIMEPLISNGGAAYVYPSSIFAEYFQPIVDKWETDEKITLKQLRNESLTKEGGRLVHWYPKSKWEKTFDTWLSSKLGWYVEREEDST